MSDLPTGGDPAAEELPDDEEILEDQEADDGEGQAGEDGGDAAEGEPDPDAEEGEGSQGQARDVTPRGRARGRAYGEQIRELQGQLTRQQQEFERQLRELTQVQRQPSAAEIAAAQEAERQRYELMSPYEQFQYSQQRIAEGVASQTRQIEQRLWEQNDQREYEGLLAATPAYRRLDDRVQDLKRQAPGVPRRVLLATAIGLRAMEQSGAATTRATNRAAAATQRNTTRPPAGRSDVGAERSRRGDDLEERLRGQAI